MFYVSVTRFHTANPTMASSDVNLADVMTSNPRTVSPDLQVREAVRILAQSRFAALPVVDGGNKLLGIATTRDIVRYLSGEYEDALLDQVQTLIAETKKRD